MIFHGLTFHTYKVYLIDFMNLNLEKNYIKKVHPPSQGLFSLPVKKGLKLFISLFYFFFVLFPQKLLKMHLKNHIKINFRENLFSRLDKILDFFLNNFSRTFAGSGKINSRKALFRCVTFRARIGL